VRLQKKTKKKQEKCYHASWTHIESAASFAGTYVFKDAKYSVSDRARQHLFTEKRLLM